MAYSSPPPLHADRFFFCQVRSHLFSPDRLFLLFPLPREHSDSDNPCSQPEEQPLLLIGHDTAHPDLSQQEQGQQDGGHREQELHGPSSAGSPAPCSSSALSLATAASSSRVI